MVGRRGLTGGMQDGFLALLGGIQWHPRVFLRCGSKNDPEDGMSDNAVEMMGLLHELARMKEMDAEFESGTKSEAETAEHENRKNRRREICDKIVGLGGTVS